MHAIALLKTVDGVFLLTGDGNQVVDFGTTEEGVQWFKEIHAERRAPGSSYERSVSSIITHIQAQPSIIEVNGMEDIIDLVTEKAIIYELKSVTFRSQGIKLREDRYHQWDDGTKPDLSTI